MLYYLGLSFFPENKLTQKKHEKAETKRMLSLFCEKPIEELKISNKAGGRPFLPESDIDFSIAHSGGAGAVSFVKGDNLRTGCDIELIKHREGAMNITEDYFSAAEKKYIFYSGKFDETRFFEIWTLKECFLKLRGLSVFYMLSVPSFISCDDSNETMFNFGASVSSPLSFRLYQLSDSKGVRYMLATVIEGIQQQPEIVWFSQISLDCMMKAEINATPNPVQEALLKN